MQLLAGSGAPAGAWQRPRCAAAARAAAAAAAPATPAAASACTLQQQQHHHHHHQQLSLHCTPLPQQHSQRSRRVRCCAAAAPGADGSSDAAWPSQQQQQQPQQPQEQQQEQPHFASGLHAARLERPVQPTPPRALAWLPPRLLAHAASLAGFLRACCGLLPEFVAPSLPEALRRLALVLGASLAMVVVLSTIDSAWLALYLSSARRVALAA